MQGLRRIAGSLLIGSQFKWVSIDEQRIPITLWKWLNTVTVWRGTSRTYYIGSSIFEVPCRQAVNAENKGAAREQNIAILGKSLSEQTLGITKVIRQVDEFLQQNSQWKNRLVESHPEFCFSKLNSNRPVLENKSTNEGQQKRLDILERYYPSAREVVEKFLADVPYRKKIDDVIDALCLAVTGMIGLESGFKTIPEDPMKDEQGILMQMVYAETYK